MSANIYQLLKINFKGKSEDSFWNKFWYSVLIKLAETTKAIGFKKILDAFQID